MSAADLFIIAPLIARLHEMRAKRGWGFKILTIYEDVIYMIVSLCGFLLLPQVLLHHRQLQLDLPHATRDPLPNMTHTVAQISEVFKATNLVYHFLKR